MFCIEKFFFVEFAVWYTPQTATAWQESKYGVISGPYFPVFGLNTGIHQPEKTSYLDTFHAVSCWKLLVTKSAK